LRRILLGLALGLLLSALQARAHKLPPRFVKGALCIHRYEGGWRANTGNGYYGGMQMDHGFQRTYGTWLYRHVGTADRWTPHQQLTISFRAYRGWKGYEGRGWYPWPNTARACGLI
jgi:integrase